MGKHLKTLFRERDPLARKAIEEFPEQFRRAIGGFYNHPETKAALTTIIRHIPFFGLRELDWSELFSAVLKMKYEAKYWNGRYPGILRNKKKIDSFASTAMSLAEFIETFAFAYDEVTAHPRFIDRPRFDPLVYAQRGEGERWVNIYRTRRGEYEQTEDGVRRVKVDVNPPDTIARFAFRPADIIRCVSKALRAAADNPPIPLTAPNVPGSGNASSVQVDLFIGWYKDFFKRERRLHKNGKGRPPWNQVIAQLLNGALNCEGDEAYTTEKVKRIVTRLERDARRKRAKKRKEANTPKS